MRCLCEFVWVLRRVYSFGRDDTSDAGNVVVDRPAADAGLAILKACGDFADGLITYEGNWLGGETFVSFDEVTVSLIAKQGQSAKLLA